MTNPTSRRNLLALMGMSASAVIVNTESLAKDDGLGNGPYPHLGQYSVMMQTRIAESLERLARGIRTGEVNAISLKTTSEIKPDNWLSHDVLLTVEMLGPEG